MLKYHFYFHRIVSKTNYIDTYNLNGDKMYKNRHRESLVRNGKTVHFSIPEEIVQTIDMAANYEGISRAAFIKRATMRETRKIDFRNGSRPAAKLNMEPVDSQTEESRLDVNRTK